MGSTVLICKAAAKVHTHFCALRNLAFVGFSANPLPLPSVSSRALRSIPHRLLKISTRFPPEPPVRSQIVLPAQVIQAVAIYAEQLRGIRFDVLGLFQRFLHPAPLERFHFLIELNPRGGQLEPVAM